MVASEKHATIYIRELNVQRREVRQTTTARIYSRPKLLSQLESLLIDEPERNNADDLLDLDRRIGR